MNPPIVSVLMPVYNAKRYLAEAVESILAQTLGDFEFIIIDDGSKDESLGVLKSYAERDGRIRLTSRANTGYVVALNEMLGQARGEFVARMDADDVSMPQRFEKQVAAMRADARIVAMGTGYDYIDQRGRVFKRFTPPEGDTELQEVALHGSTPICHPTAMARREAMVAAGGYDPALMPAEDLDLWLRLGEVGRLANLAEPLVKYRIHPMSISEKRGEQQYRNLREACERAWKRRGVQREFRPAQHWRPGADRHSRHDFAVSYGWSAFQLGQRKAALAFAAQAIKLRPFSEKGWRLLACSLIKPMGAHR